MKKISTILMTLCIIALSTMGQTNKSYLDVEYDIGDQNLTSITEDGSSTEIPPAIITQDTHTGNSLMAPVESNYIVKRGERPPIDIMTVPVDAYEKGILKIKLDESFTSQLDNNPVYMTDDGTVVFNIAAIDQLNKQYSPSGFKRLFECDAFTSEFTDRHRAWGFHLWYKIYFDDNTNIKELVLAYEQLAEVSTAEPEYKKVLSDSDKGGSVSPPVDWTPNDPGYGLQWHYHNTGQYSGTVDADIDLPEAWDLETGNSNIIVAVIDMGIQYDHPDLIGNMWPGIGYDFYNGNTSIEPGYHGTHVAGTVAAETDNGIGVAGVAGGTGSNDGVRLMSCQVFTPSGAGGGIELAPIWAADNGATISQNSWNYTSYNYYDQPVLDAIDYFNANGGGTALSGGITIFSAGNSYGTGTLYPGCYSGTFAVAATDNHDVKAPYSTYGTWVDVSAPGGDNTVMDERAVYSTYTSSTYDYIDGTSMACPHVSGTAALIISMAYGELTPTDVADILRNTTDDIDALNPTYIGKLGTGRLNAFQALLETQNYLIPPGTLMPLPAHASTYTGNTRGYWFTAPTDFIVTGLRVPTDITGDQTIEIVRFNSGPPPTFSGTTNDFVSLGRWVSVAGSGFITCYIPVSNGDHIGILGCRGTTNSYGVNNYVTSINGHATTLVRLGMQYQLPSTVAQDLWQEPVGATIGRVEMYYESLPGIWEGDVNQFWNQAGNWSNGVVPDAGTNVTIPDGTPYDCWVSTNDAVCNNLTIEPGSYLRIYDEVLTVNGSMDIHGLLRMEEWSGTPGELHVAGNIVWEAGSTADILSSSLNMFISGNWNFESGANVQLDQGYVTFEGGLNSWIRSYDSDCYFSHIRNEKTGTYGLAVSELSSDDLYINGNIYNYSGNLIRFRSDHSVILSGFLNNMGGHLEGQFGTLVFDGWPGTTTLKPNTGDYLNNVTFSTSSPVELDNAYSNLLTINGDLLIDAGGIEANNFTIEVAGTWANNVGTGGFVEGTSTVRFIKPDPGVQMINSTEHFNILECATEASTGIRPAGGTDVSCNVYDWTSGSISAVGSTFTAFDLADNGLYGRLFAHPYSELIFHQVSGFVDLFCTEVFIDNGLIQVIGGGDESYWCGSVDLDLTIENGGVFDFDGPGITIHDTYLINETITSSSSIKTSGWFACYKSDFNPGGIFEFYGGNDSRIEVYPGSTFNDLVINKSGGDKSSFQFKDRDGTSNTSSKSNTAILYSDVVVNNDLKVNAGSLTLNGYELTVLRDSHFYGTLNMTNPADVYNGGDGVADQFLFYNGSIGNISAGIINLSWGMVIYSGASFTATTANTINYTSSTYRSGVANDDPNTVFGNINVNKPAGYFQIWNDGAHPIVVNGNFNLDANNSMEIQDLSLIAHGDLTETATSSIYLYNFYSKDDIDESSSSNDEIKMTKSSSAKGGLLEIDNNFTLNGLLDVADGDVLLHGDFHIAPTGILDITTGTVIADQPYSLAEAWQNMEGTINLTNGLLELSHNSFNFTSTAVNNISGGILRCGFTFSALYAGTFQPIGGLVEFTGTGYDARIEMEASNYFNDVVINRTESLYLGTNIYIQNDLEISSGQLFAYNYGLTPYDIYLGGNWTNTVGTAAFDEGTGTVFFNGTGDVAINNNETFYNLTLDKVNSGDWLNLYGDVGVLGDLTINPGALYSGPNALSVSGNVTMNSGGVLYMQANSTLAFGAGSQLVSYNGSAIYAVGSAGNEPLVTHISSGTYGFSIWGTIGAQNAIFEYMDGNGINVKDGGYVHPTFTFNNCTFRDGAPSPSALLVLNNDQVFTCDDARFEQNASGNTGYNVWKALPQGDVLFNNATGDFAGEAYDYDPDNRVDWFNIGFTVSGSVNYDNGASTALSSINVTLMDGVIPVATDVSDGSGDYEFADVPDGTYTIESTTSKPWGGLSMNDVQLARQYVTGQPPGNGLSGLHLQAADVDLTSTVNMNDVQFMRQKVTSQPPGFTSFWLFEEPTVNVSGASVTQDFEGICGGDTDGSYVPPLAD